MCAGKIVSIGLYSHLGPIVSEGCDILPVAVLITEKLPQNIACLCTRRKKIKQCMMDSPGMDSSSSIDSEEQFIRYYHGFEDIWEEDVCRDSDQGDVTRDAPSPEVLLVSYLHA